MSTSTSTGQHALHGALVGLQPRLRRFAYGLCGSLDEADDLVQAAYERALPRLHQWQTGTRLDSWMYRILRNVWLNRVAAEGVRQRHAAQVVATRELAPATGGDALEASLSLERVREHVAALPPEQREALLLVAVEGLSYREAAEVAGVPAGTITSRLARARGALRDIFDGLGTEGPARQDRG